MNHTQIKLSKTARNNLLKLARGLLTQTPPPRFGMQSYMTFKNEGYVSDTYLDGNFYSTDVAISKPDIYTDPKCGTVACAAGHGPLYGMKKRKDEEWSDYVYRVFLPLADASYDAYFFRSAVFDWLFSAHWSDTDNTPKGAAARILYLLDNGLPENAREVMLGREAKPYTRYKKLPA